MVATQNMKSRYQGALLGLAIGDALGTTLEFKSPGTFGPISDMVGGGPFRLLPGQWTDDTSMALCLTESLMIMQKFDPADQMHRYRQWYREGHLSSNGTCFDIGRTVQSALCRFESTGEPFCGLDDEWSAGNGSLMRLAPIPMTYRSSMSLVWEMAIDSSKTTHAAQACLDACGVFSTMIARALNGESKEVICDFADVDFPCDYSQIDPEIRDVISGSYKVKEPPRIRGTGYVVESLEAALWAFWKSSSFREGALMAVNLGDDADTTGAIYGQLAGAYYGVDAIPDQWRQKLFLNHLISFYAERLYFLSEKIEETSLAVLSKVN